MKFFDGVNVSRNLFLLALAVLLFTACTDYEQDYEDLYGWLEDASASSSSAKSSSSVNSDSDSESSSSEASSASSAKSSSSVISDPDPEFCSSSISGSSIKYGTLVDERDGQTYKTVKIGSQIWMAENLNYNYNKGTAKSFCYNDSTKYCDTYGRLYLWSAAMDSAGVFSDAGKGCGYGDYCYPSGRVRGVCPEGWHLPSIGEWDELRTAVGGSSSAGTVFKSETGWYGGGNGSDAYGFSALPAGYRYGNGYFGNVGGNAYFWSSSENGSNIAYGMYLYYNNEFAGLGYDDNRDGFSVRCLQDLNEGDSSSFAKSSSSSAKSSSSVNSAPDSKSSSSEASSSSSAKSSSSVNSAPDSKSSSSEASSSSSAKSSSSVNPAPDPESSSSEETSSSSAKSSSSVNPVPELESSSSEISSSSSSLKVEDPGSEYDPIAKTLTDLRDSQIYKTVEIGAQTWMAENLNYNCNKGIVKSFCYNNASSNCETYGRLYLWSAAMDSATIFGDAGKGCGYGGICSPSGTVRGVCPEGWHLPSKSEWKELFTAVGGSDSAGTKLKAKTGWNSGGDGTDAYGFSALPAGDMFGYGSFYDVGLNAYFWSSTEGGSGAYYMDLYYDSEYAGLSDGRKNSGFSVRCLLD